MCGGASEDASASYWSAGDEDDTTTHIPEDDAASKPARWSGHGDGKVHGRAVGAAPAVGRSGAGEGRARVGGGAPVGEGRWLGAARGVAGHGSEDQWKELRAWVGFLPGEAMTKRILSPSACA